MRNILLLASAAAMAVSMPAFAKPGKGGGQGAGPQASVKANAKPGKARVRTDVRARTDARANARARQRSGASVDRAIDRNGNGIADYRERRLADANGNGVPDYRERRIVDINGNGIADYRERRIDRDRNGVDDRAQRRYGGEACPPGLAKKTPACVPPGQAKGGFEAGSRLPTQYRYMPVPSDYLTHERYLDALERYDPDDYRYYYDDGDTDRVYVVDPRTRLIREVIDLIL